MVKEAKVKKDFTLEEHPDSTTFNITAAKSPQTIAKTYAVIIVLIIISIGLFDPIKEDYGLIYSISFALLPFFIWLATKGDSKFTIKLTKEGIISQRTLFRYENIERTAVKSTVTSYNYKTVDNLPYTNGIYIMHGKTTVWLATGLHDSRAATLFEAFKGAVSRYRNIS